MATINKRVKVYVCPTEDCPNYYASSSMQVPLESQRNIRSSLRNLATEDPSVWGQVSGTRDECPTCRSRGIVAKRVPVEVTLAVPVPEPTPVAT